MAKRSCSFQPQPVVGVAQFLACTYSTRWPRWMAKTIQLLFAWFCIIIKFSSRRTDRLLLLSSNMATVTSEASHQWNTFPTIFIWKAVTPGNSHYQTSPRWQQIRELKHARFWDADGNRKRTFLRARTVVSPTFLYQSSLMNKRYLAM